MGKGDKKTKRGKIIIGSYGVKRARKSGIQSVPTSTKVVEEKKVKEVKPKATKPKESKEPVKKT